MKPLAVIALLLAAGAARAAPLDMNTTTCQDWIDADQDEQDRMIAWLRGYVAGRGTGAMFDLSGLRGDTVTLRRFCQSHAATGLVSAAAQFGH